MATNGTITSVGLMNGFSLSLTGESTSAALTPIVAGVLLNSNGGYACIGVAGSSSGGGHIDFATA